MKLLITGAAGFIGFHLSKKLLAEGHAVVGVDNLNDYYDVKLKEARLAQLTPQKNFTFYREDFSDREAMHAVVLSHEDITHIVHLGAQAGVRHSLTDPYIYITSNVMAQTVILECARLLPRLEHVYASSSSVYGGNTKLPFSESDRVDHPVSLYAATKKANELISHAYGHIYQIPTTGLRYFTVYGPWGRPDMAAYIFVRKIFAGEPIEVFNHGKMQRDFTYIDDIIAGTCAAIARVPSGSGVPAKVYNLGNNNSEDLMQYIHLLEKAVGREAQKIFLPLQPGDVPATYADIAEAERDLGFKPTTSIEEGIPKFVQWYREYHNLSSSPLRGEVGRNAARRG